MIEVIMPKLGLTMEEGTIIHWLKREGEEVEKGEPLFEVQTDKVNMEVEAPASGTLGKILVPEGDTVPVVQVIAYLLEPGEEAPEEWPTPAAVTEAAPVKAKVLATPAARRLARDKGIKAGLLRPITLYPLPFGKLLEIADRVKGMLSVEMNTGQMVEDVRLAVNGKIPAHHFGRCGGMVHSPNEVLEALEETRSGVL